MGRSSVHTFLFADLAGFTALTEAHGDDDAADLVAHFLGAVRELLPETAEVVKSIGDAVMIRCDNAADAVQLAVRIAHDVGGRHGFPVIRVGMHTGPATQREHDWFGATVNLAARISAVAGCDEILLSDATRTQAGTLDGIVLRERGRRALRNVAEPVVLFEVVRETERAASGLPIDPVCRMAVDPQSAAGSLRHNGVTYHFCSLACARSFAERPDRYAANATAFHRR